MHILDFAFIVSINYQRRNIRIFSLRFVVDSANFLQQHLETEGLFRKSGSIQRQKLLKVSLLVHCSY